MICRDFAAGIHVAQWIALVITYGATSEVTQGVVGRLFAPDHGTEMFESRPWHMYRTNFGLGSDFLCTSQNPDKSETPTVGRTIIYRHAFVSAQVAVLASCQSLWTIFFAAAASGLAGREFRPGN
jgi:hypothetical protein